MDNPAYAKKYDAPYTGDDVDKVERIMKQSVDARHVEDQSGVYVGAAASDDPFTLGAELGGFHYLTHSVEGRVGLKGLLGTGENDFFAGIDTGLRVQAPISFRAVCGCWDVPGRQRKVGTGHGGLSGQ